MGGTCSRPRDDTGTCLQGQFGIPLGKSLEENRGRGHLPSTIKSAAPSWTPPGSPKPPLGRTTRTLTLPRHMLNASERYRNPPAEPIFNPSRPALTEAHAQGCGAIQEPAYRADFRLEENRGRHMLKAAGRYRNPPTGPCSRPRDDTGTRLQGQFSTAYALPLLRHMLKAAGRYRNPPTGPTSTA